MDDANLTALFVRGDERAIAEAESKYGSMLRRFALRILGNSEDAEECLNDVWLQAWRAIPANPPDNLPAFLTTLTRRIALNRLKANNRLMRGGGQTPAALEELSECIPAPDSVEAEYDRRRFLEALNRFLETLPHDARVIFVRRYWYLNTTAEIAEAYRTSDVKVRVTLMRTRKKLKAFLEKEESL